MPQRSYVVKKHKDSHGDNHTIPCCWDDCGRDGVELYKYVEVTSENRLVYLFCSEKHRQYWKYASKLGHGKLPTGWKNQYLPLR